MGWDRGAWERTTSGGAPYGGSSGGYIGHGSSGTTVSANCKKMKKIIKLMRKGQSMDDACKELGINPKVAKEWYNKGWSGEGNSKCYRDFYHDVSMIYSARENKTKTPKKVKVKQKESSKPKEIPIETQMQRIISQMKNGRTMSQAARNVGVPVYKVNEWYDLGWKKNKEPYTSFYNKVSNIEISKRKKITPSKSNVENQMNEFVREMRKGLTRKEAARKVGLSITTVTDWYNKGSRGDSNYVKFYNNVKSIENTREKYKTPSKSKSTTSNMVKCSKCGKRYNNKYNRGCPHCKKSSVSKSKSTTSNMVKCSKCGKRYNNRYNRGCPHCKKSENVNKVRYCKNCGKKITNDKSIYCTKCGASLKTGMKPKSTNTIKTTSKNSSFDWTACCVMIVVVFVLMALLGLL